MARISASYLNSYDKYPIGFIWKYIYRLPEDDFYGYMKFGRWYEKQLSKKLFKGYKNNVKFEVNIGGYDFIGYLDFVKDNEMWEVKTSANGWLTKTKGDKSKKLLNDWQFRLYNWYANKYGYDFYINDFAKNDRSVRRQKINFEDENFESNVVNKIQEIEKFKECFKF